MATLSSVEALLKAKLVSALSATATFDAPHQYSEGARYVFVNGQPAVFAGHPTGALAGRALQRPKRTKAN